MTTMQKPEIIQILWGLDRGGAERMAFQLACGLRERNWRVRMIAAGGGGDLQEEIERTGIPLHIGPDTRNRFATLNFLRRELPRRSSAIYHTHLGADIWAGLIARTRGIPWVATAHSQEEHQPRLRTWMHERMLRQATHVACVSKEVQNRIWTQAHVPIKRTSVIPCGIDVQLFSTRAHIRHLHDIPRFISVGRLVSGKRHALLLEALAAIRRPWQLELVGDGPERSSLTRLAQRLGILPRIKFTGSVEPKRVAQLLQESDVFCFPSEQEGQGLSVLEAATSGLPLILSNLPVYREWFQPNDVTFVHETTPHAWTSALEQIWTAPPTFFARAEPIAQRVRDQASLDTMVMNYEAIYSQLTPHAHPSRQ